MIAATDAPWFIPALCIGVTLGLSLFIFGALWLVKGFLKRAENAQNQCFEGLDIPEVSRSGDVFVRFHTYYGLLGASYQIRHEVYLPPTDARKLRRRLHRFNLTWGLIGMGILYVPFCSAAEQRRELKSIARQELNPPVDRIF